MTFLQAKISNLQPNLEEWTDENYNKFLKDAFQNCLPHIRYFQIPGEDILIKKIKPYKNILEGNI